MPDARVHARAALGVMTICMSFWPMPVLAQAFAHPLFVLTVRDPGPLDVPPTARSLALGRAPSLSGNADGVGRDRAGFDARLVRRGCRSPRGGRWRPFLDSTERYDHQLETASAGINFISSPGGIVTSKTDASGRGSVSETMTRVGGAVAVAGTERRIAVGAAIFGTQVKYSAQASLDETTETDILVPRSHSSSNAVESEYVDVAGWGVSWTLNAVAKPTAWAAISARWKREPRFSGGARH